MPGKNYYLPFEAGEIYHIYNRSIDRKPLFTREKNYAFFLQKFDLYLSPFLYVYAWCLMNNHFHLMVRIKELADFKNLSQTINDDSLNTFGIMKDENGEPDVFKTVSHAFQRLFQSYAMAFNKQEGRIGSLFQSPLKRNLVDNQFYFTNLIYYIHANPQLHGFIDDFRFYPWSSYGRIISHNPTKLRKEEVIDWFGGKNVYEIYHASQPKLIIPIELYED